MGNEIKALSLNERISLVCDALWRGVDQFLSQYPRDAWVHLVYDDHAIVRHGEGLLWRVNYVIEDGVVLLAPFEEWERVEQEWVTVAPVKSLIDGRRMGGMVGIKSVTKDTAIIAGYGVVFGGIDLYGDTFTEETDFKYSNPNPPLFYDHTMTGVEEDLGVVVKTKKDKFGIWMESQIDLHKNYAKQVLSLAEKGGTWLLHRGN